MFLGSTYKQYYMIFVFLFLTSLHLTVSRSIHISANALFLFLFIAIAKNSNYKSFSSRFLKKPKILYPTQERPVAIGSFLWAFGNKRQQIMCLNYNPHIRAKLSRSIMVSSISALLPFGPDNSSLWRLSSILWDIEQHPWPLSTRCQYRLLSPLVTIKCISRHCQCLLGGGQNCTWLGTNGLWERYLSNSTRIMMSFPPILYE